MKKFLLTAGFLALSTLTVLQAEAAIYRAQALAAGVDEGFADTYIGSHAKGPGFMAGLISAWHARVGVGAGAHAAPAVAGRAVAGAVALPLPVVAVAAAVPAGAGAPAGGAGEGVFVGVGGVRPVFHYTRTDSENVKTAYNALQNALNPFGRFNFENLKDRVFGNGREEAFVDPDALLLEHRATTSANLEQMLREAGMDPALIIPAWHTYMDRYTAFFAPFIHAVTDITGCIDALPPLNAEYREMMIDGIPELQFVFIDPAYEAQQVGILRSIFTSIALRNRILQENPFLTPDYNKWSLLSFMTGSPLIHMGNKWAPTRPEVVRLWTTYGRGGDTTTAEADARLALQAPAVVPTEPIEVEAPQPSLHHMTTYLERVAALESTPKQEDHMPAFNLESLGFLDGVLAALNAVPKSASMQLVHAYDDAVKDHGGALQKLLADQLTARGIAIDESSLQTWPKAGLMMAGIRYIESKVDYSEYDRALMQTLQIIRALDNKYAGNIFWDLLMEQVNTDIVAHEGKCGGGARVRSFFLMSYVLEFLRSHDPYVG